MKDAISVIGGILDEHEQIARKVRKLGEIANDLDAVSRLGGSGGDFMPGRLEDQRRSLHSLQESLEAVDEGLHAHFDREEKGLLESFEKHGGRKLATALRTLLLEHRELGDRITRLKKDTAELATEELSREVWEGKAWGIKAYIRHTGKLLEAHAQSEVELMQTLKSELSKS